MEVPKLWICALIFLLFVLIIGIFIFNNNYLEIDGVKIKSSNLEKVIDMSEDDFSFVLCNLDDAKCTVIEKRSLS